MASRHLPSKKETSKVPEKKLFPPVSRSRKNSAKKYSISCGDYLLLRRCVEVSFTDAAGLQQRKHLSRSGLAKQLRSIVNSGAEALTLRRCWVSDFCWQRYLGDTKTQ